MPENTVKVDRTTKWGNSWKVGDRGLDDLIETKEDAAREFRYWIDDLLSGEQMGWKYDFLIDARRELRGKNLACWCPLPEPGQPDHCHAAVLLEIANALPSPHTEKEG